MISKIIKIGADGTIRIPPEVWKEVGITPPEDINIQVDARGITLVPRAEPVDLTREDRELFDRIGQLLRESFAGADAEQVWTEIHLGRRDRCRHNPRTRGIVDLAGTGVQSVG